MKKELGPAIVVVLALLSGCGEKPAAGPAPAGAGPKTPAVAAPAIPAGLDACSILSADDIKAATGKAIASSNHGPSNTSTVCDYVLEGGDKMVFVVYTSSAKKTFENAPGDPAAGIGDAAKWNKTVLMLSVLKGDKAFIITMPYSMAEKADEALAAAKGLAAKVMAKI